MKKLFIVIPVQGLRAGKTIALAAVLAITGMNGAVAQSAKDLVGTWTLVSADAYGPNPKGTLMFDANGHFSSQFIRSDLPKYASNNRAQGTPEEYKATVQGYIGYFGTYSLKGRICSFTLKVVRSQIGMGPTRSGPTSRNRRSTAVFATYPLGGWVTHCSGMETRKVKLILRRGNTCRCVWYLRCLPS